MWTLDIIVEGAVLLPVLPEEAEGVVVPEVLKLDQCVLAVFFHHSLHELINQIIVSLRVISLLVQAHVQRILEESLIGGQGQMYEVWSIKHVRAYLIQHTHNHPTWLFVPTSMATGRHLSGLMPAQAVYRQSFPTGMPIPYTPRSPNPKIRSPSVTTTAWWKRGRWKHIWHLTSTQLWTINWTSQGDVETVNSAASIDKDFPSREQFKYSLQH